MSDLEIVDYRETTPEILATLKRVGKVVEYNGDKVQTYFDAHLEDSTAVVRAVVFDRAYLHPQFKELEGRRVLLEAGSYKVTRPRVKRSENIFEINLTVPPKLFRMRDQEGFGFL